jgi:PadR family transcriptional regulator PadR
MFRDFFLGFIKVHILHHAAEEPIYGLAMMEELERHGYEISPGTLYPILHSMEEEGWLTREERVVGGRIRKYYRATNEGRAALADVKEKIRELVEEVLEGHGPERLPEPSEGRWTRVCSGSTFHARTWTWCSRACTWSPGILAGSHPKKERIRFDSAIAYVAL